MNEQNKKVPTVRFKGFTNDWEQRKLGDLMNVTSVKRIHQSDWQSEGIPFFRARDIVALNKGEKISEPLYISKEKYEDYSRISGKVKYNDLLVTGVGTIGIPFLVRKTPLYFKDGNIIWFQNNNKINGYFLYISFLTSSMQDYIRSSTGVGTVPTYTIKSGKETPIKYPISIEQDKITATIKRVSDIVTLQQRKLDLLKQLKKGFLQKMFAEKNSKQPVLRFKGFHDDWEQRRLGEVTSHRGGTAIEKYFDENGEYKVISIGSYGLDSKYVDQNIRAKSNEVTNERVVHAGELTMVLNDKTANGTIIGRSLLIENDNEYVINQRTEIIKPKESFNAKFAYTLLNGPFRNKVKRIIQGGTQIYVNYSSVEKLTVPLPNMKEQQKIGSFFNQLDSLIALHQRKQNHLKLLKKSLLQQMFM